MYEECFSVMPQTPWVLRNSRLYLFLSVLEDSFGHLLREEEGTAYCRVIGEAHIPSLISTNILGGISLPPYCQKDVQVEVLHLASAKHPLTPTGEECISGSSARAGGVGSL